MTIDWQQLEREDDRRLGRELAALAEQALAEGQPKASPFLDGDQRRIAQLLFEGQDELFLRFYGGYRQASRRRAVLVPRLYLEEQPLRVVGAVWLRPHPEVACKGEEDARSLLQQAGLMPGDIGDVLAASEGGWQAVVAQEAMEALLRWAEEHLPAGVLQPIELERLDAPPESVKEIRTTVASLRLDAVASSGFGISRSKMVAEIKAGRVRLNWEVVTHPARPVRGGDVIAIPGRGRVIVEHVGEGTRKGRLPLTLKRVR